MRFLLYAFPRRFRDRYGAEVLELVRESDAPLRDAADLVLSGASLRARQILGFMRSRGTWMLLAVVVAPPDPEEASWKQQMHARPDRARWSDRPGARPRSGSA